MANNNREVFLLHDIKTGEITASMTELYYHYEPDIIYWSSWSCFNSILNNNTYAYSIFTTVKDHINGETTYDTLEIEKIYDDEPTGTNQDLQCFDDIKPKNISTYKSG